MYKAKQKLVRIIDINQPVLKLTALLFLKYSLYPNSNNIKKLQVNNTKGINIKLLLIVNLLIIEKII